MLIFISTVILFNTDSTHKSSISYNSFNSSTTNKKQKLIIISSISSVVLIIAIILLVVFTGENGDKDKKEIADTTTDVKETTESLEETESETSTEPTTETLAEVQTEQQTEPPTEVPAEQREKVGSYTEKDLGNSFYQRTWENGAIRYYYYESMFGTYYEVSTPGTIPDWILDDVNSKMDGAGQSTTTTEDSSQQQTQPSNNEEESQYDPFSDPNKGHVGDDYDPDAPIAGDVIG